MTIRSAQALDIDAMYRIIGHHASEGLMLPRSKAGLGNSLHQYVVADLDGRVVGCGGLQPYSADSAEIFGLATAAAGSPAGTGTAIVEYLVDGARLAGFSSVFALTLAPGFFEKLGFFQAEHRSLPLKVWTDCVSCPKFGNCDEVAMILRLDAAAARLPKNATSAQIA